MKILFFGDYSGVQACMAREFRRRGHDVTLVSDGGGYMETDFDIRLDRKAGKIGGLRYFMQLIAMLPKFRGYDVVYLRGPHFIDLRPEKMRIVFDYLRKHNRFLILTLASDDYYFCDECKKGEIFRFSEFYVGDRKTEFEEISHRAEGWTTPEIYAYNSYVYSKVDGAISVLPEYDMAARKILGDRVEFVNLPIDIESLPYKELKVEGKLRFFVGMKLDKIVQKGTRDMLAALRRLEREYPDLCEVESVSNVSLEEYIKRMKSSHVVVDQLYSYSPATNALQAMALGLVAASGGMPEYYDYIDRDADNSDIYAIDREPIVRLSPLEDYEAVFREMILNPSILEAKSRAGRKLVERHNGISVVADRMERQWDYMMGVDE